MCIRLVEIWALSPNCTLTGTMGFELLVQQVFNRSLCCRSLDSRSMGECGKNKFVSLSTCIHWSFAQVSGVEDCFESALDCLSMLTQTLSHNKCVHGRRSLLHVQRI